MAGRRRRDRPAVRPGVRLAVVLALLAGCQWAGDDGQGATARPTTGAATKRIDLAAEPWALLAEPGGLWVVLSDHTVARYDTATARLDGAPVRLPFTPGAMVTGHGHLWIGGQVDGRRRVTRDGNYPVIQVARVDPRRRVVTGLVALPMRSNGNRLASTPNAIWVTDPAEGPLSRVWRIDPAANRVTATVPLDELVAAMAADGDGAWVATIEPNAILRLSS